MNKKWIKKKKFNFLFQKLFDDIYEITAILVEINNSSFITISKDEKFNFSKNSANYINTLFEEENIKIVIYIWGKNIEKILNYLNLNIFYLKELIKSEFQKRAVTEEALERYRELAFLSHIAFELNKSLDLKVVSSTLINECRQIAPESKFGGIFLLENNNFKLLSCFGDDGENIAEKISKTKLFKEIIFSKKVEIINQVANDKRWDVFIPQIISFLGASLYSSNKILGGIFLAGTAPFSSIHVKSISTIVNFGSISIANAIHFNEIQRLLEATIISLATAIDSRDPCTAGHSRRTAQYAWALATAISEDEEYFPEINFSEEEMRELYYAALLHDVGKIGVKESILSKATKIDKKRIEVIILKLKLLKNFNIFSKDYLNLSKTIKKLEQINTQPFLTKEDKELIEKLSKLEIKIDKKIKIKILDEEEKKALLIPYGNLLPEEWDEIKNHPVESYRILNQIIFPQTMRNLIRIVREHHEKLDGTGYPDGKREGELLLQSKILTVCDIYDALTAADRPYKKAFSIEKAISILKEEAEKGKLDEKVVNIFIKKVLGFNTLIQV